MSHGFFRRLSWEDLKSEIIPGMVSETCFVLCTRKLAEGFAEAGCFQHYKCCCGSSAEASMNRSSAEASAEAGLT